MKHALIPVTLLMVIGCSDANTRQTTCGATIQANANSEILKNPLDLGAGLGGYLKMKSDSAERPETFCNAFPQYHPQTKSYIMFSGVHCFGKTKLPQGAFYLSQNLGYMPSEAKELYREKLLNSIAKIESIGPKTVAVLKDRSSYSQGNSPVTKCQIMTDALSPEILSKYSIACFSGADLRVAQVSLKGTGKFKSDFNKLQKNTVELGKADEAAGFEHSKAFASLAVAREFAIQSKAIVYAMGQIALASAGNVKDPELVKELSSPEAQKTMLNWQWDNLAPLIGMREMDKTLAASAVITANNMSQKEFEKFATTASKLISLQKDFIDKAEEYELALYNLAKKNVKLDDIKVKVTVKNDPDAQGIVKSQTTHLSLGKAVPMDKLTEKDAMAVHFDDENKAVLMLVKKGTKDIQKINFEKSDSGSALMSEDGVIALTLVTWDGVPVEGILRPPVDVQPHFEPSDKPTLAGGKDKKPGKATTDTPEATQNGGGFLGDLAGAFAKVLTPSEKQPPENAENKPSTQPKTEDDTKPIEEGPANNRGKIAMVDKSDSDANGQKGSTTTGIRSCN